MNKRIDNGTGFGRIVGMEEQGSEGKVCLGLGAGMGLQFGTTQRKSLTTVIKN